MTCIIDGCDNPCEGSLWICATHNAEKRKAEREAKKVKIIKPIKKMSAKRAEQVPVYSKLKMAFLEDKMMCELQFEGCFKLATQIHHVSKSDLNFLNTETWKRACANCHPIAEALPAEQRREMGLLTD